MDLAPRWTRLHRVRALSKTQSMFITQPVDRGFAFAIDFNTESQVQCFKNKRLKKKSLVFISRNLRFSIAWKRKLHVSSISSCLMKFQRDEVLFPEGSVWIVLITIV